MNEDFITDFRETILQAYSEMQRISDNIASNKKDATQWSIKEVIGHLIDSASNNHQLFIRMQIDKEIRLPFYQQVDFVRISNYQSEDWTILLDFWKLYNLHLVHIVENIDEQKLENVWITPKGEKLDLKFVVEDYLIHLKHHLSQIKSRSV